MTLRRAAPAPYHAFVAMLAHDRDAWAARKLFTPESLAKLHLLPGMARSWGLSTERGALACMGLIPLGVDEDGYFRFEAWLACWPQLAAHLRAFVREAQLTLRELPQDAIVEARFLPQPEGEPPGMRIARLVGFRETADPEVWEWRHEGHS